MRFVLVVLILSTMLVACGRSVKDAEAGLFSRGNAVVLRNPTIDEVFVAVDRKAFEATKEAKDDEQEADRLVLAQKVFRVDNGTEAKILEYDPFERGAEVRIESGPKAGKTG